MSEQSIVIPFGDGEATIIGWYSSEEKPTEFCPGEDAYFEINQVIVGGVDIYDELQCLYKKVCVGNAPQFILADIEDKCLELLSQELKDNEDEARIDAWLARQEEY